MARHCTLFRLATSYGIRAASQMLGNCSMFACGGNSNSKFGAKTPTMIGAGPNVEDTGRGLPIIEASLPKRCWKYSLLRIAMVGNCGGGALGGAGAGAGAGAAPGERVVVGVAGTPAPAPATGA